MPNAEPRADVLFHPEAEGDYQAALAWYEARSVRAAARFERETERVLGLIAVHPGMFPAYDEQHRFAVLRRFPYSIVYRTEPGRVVVIAVAHGSRSARYWLDRG